MLLRRVPPLLLIAAIATYGAMLYGAHRASQDASGERYVQQLAEVPERASNVIANSREGSLLLEPLPGGNAYAEWRLPAVAKTFAPGTAVLREEAFVTGLDISLFRSDSSATIALDGKRIGAFRPLVPSADDEGPFAVAHPPLGGIDIPPGYTTAFRFPLAAPGACVASTCTLRIEVKNATWVVRRIGVVFTVEPPAAPALWKRPEAAWFAIGIALAFAGLSHLVLATRPRARRVAG